MEKLLKIPYAVFNDWNQLNHWVVLNMLVVLWIYEKHQFNHWEILNMLVVKLFYQEIKYQKNN